MLISSKYLEKSGYGLDLDLLTNLYRLHVLYPKRSGLVGKKKSFKTYLPLLDIIFLQFLVF